MKYVDQQEEFSFEDFAYRFETSCLAPECEGERDPRCLPLHVFQQRGSYALSLSEGRVNFDLTHGTGAYRVDRDGREWRLSPRDYHGYEQLHVAGTNLRRGFHWDVQPGGGSTLIVTTSEVWKVSRYVNIYPDAHVRGDRPHAKRVV